jgi:aconitate hydratase
MVVGKFVEFYGDGLDAAGGPRDDRQYVARVWRDLRLFPIDAVTLDYMRLTGRSEEQVALVEAMRKRRNVAPARR